jgi:protein TonB
MFQQTFVPESNRTRSGASLLVSLAAQVMVLIVLVLIPLVYTEALPGAALRTLLTAPAPPPPMPPPPPVNPTVVKRAPRVFEDGILRAPTHIPETVALIQEDDMPPDASRFGVDGIVPGLPNVPNQRITGFIDGVAPPPSPAPVVTQPKPRTTQPVRVSEGVIQAALIRKVVPPYPPLARQARIQGTVQFTAIIGRDGTIQNLQLISGNPLLVPAARDAIKQWVYKPTILNTEAVEVITQIEFTFRLN